MRRFFPVLLAPFLAVLAHAAPVPKDAKEPVYYYPTTVGAKWVYEDSGGDFVLVVSKVEDRKGTKVVSVERVGEKQNTPYAVMEVSATGLVQTRCEPGELDPPQVVLKVPFKARDSWNFDYPGATGIAAQKGTSVIAGVEKIKVPAGTFEAVRVDTDYTSEFGGETTKAKISAWYAPNVGLVKMTEGDNVLWLLKSFTPGKE